MRPLLRSCITEQNVVRWNTPFVHKELSGKTKHVVWGDRYAWLFLWCVHRIPDIPFSLAHPLPCAGQALALATHPSPRRTPPPGPCAPQGCRAAPGYSVTPGRGWRLGPGGPCGRRGRQACPLPTSRESRPLIPRRAAQGLSSAGAEGRGGRGAHGQRRSGGLLAPVPGLACHSLPDLYTYVIGPS